MSMSFAARPPYSAKKPADARARARSVAASFIFAA
jgi:hypothetical protein